VSGVLEQRKKAVQMWGMAPVTNSRMFEMFFREMEGTETK